MLDISQKLNYFTCQDVLLNKRVNNKKVLLRVKICDSRVSKLTIKMLEFFYF